MPTKLAVDDKVTPNREAVSQGEVASNTKHQKGRVVLLGSMYPPEVGALCRRAYSMAVALSDSGYEVQVVTHLPHYPKRVIFPEYQGKFICREPEPYGGVLRIKPLLFKKQSFFWRSIGEMWFASWAVILGVWGKKPRVVFATSPTMFALFAGRLIATLRRAPLVVELRDLTWLYATALSPSMAKIARILEGRILRIARGANGVFCANSSIRDYLVEHGVRPETCITVSNGVDSKLLASQTATHSERTGGHAMYVGLLGHAQGLHVLVEAAALLKDDPRYRITFVGDGPELKNLTALAEEHGLTNVEFVGSVPSDQLGKWYEQSDILIVNLRGESAFDHALPSKLFEYMAAKKPILFGGNGPGADVVREAQAGIVVTPDKADEMADALRYLVANPDKALEYGRNGYHHVVQHYRREVILERVTAFFDTL